MKAQDELRHWIRKQIAARGRGARANLADFLGLTPLKITYMLNIKAGKQTRNILADEWLKILLFLGMEESNPAVPRAVLEQSKPVIALPPYSAARPAEYAVLTKILDNAKPKQREAIVNLARALAETYNIPH